MSYASGGAWRSLGAGLRGIGQTAGGVRRQREQDERQRMLDEQRQQYYDTQMDLTLADRGGARGDVPSFDVPTELPTLGRGQTQTESMQDPRFQGVGGIGYIMRPDQREQQQYETGQFREQERAQAERDRLMGLMEPLDHIPEASRPALAGGLSPGLALPPEPDRPDDINWQTLETADGFVQVNPRTGETRPLGYQGRDRSTGQERGPISLSQAMDQIYAMYADPVTGEIPLSPQEQYELAVQMSQGGPLSLPEPMMPEMPPVMEEPKPEPGLWDRFRGAVGRGLSEPDATAREFGGRAREELNELLPVAPEPTFDVAGALGATPVDTIPPEQVPAMVQQWAAEGVPREEVQRRLAEMGYR